MKAHQAINKNQRLLKLNVFDMHSAVKLTRGAKIKMQQMKFSIKESS